MAGYLPKPGHFVKSGTCKEHDFGYLKTANCPTLDQVAQWHNAAAEALPSALYKNDHGKSPCHKKN